MSGSWAIDEVNRQPAAGYGSDSFDERAYDDSSSLRLPPMPRFISL